MCKEDLHKGSHTRLVTYELLKGQQQQLRGWPILTRILRAMVKLLKGQQLQDKQDVWEGLSLAVQEDL